MSRIPVPSYPTDPPVEGFRAVRGILYGLAFGAVFWAGVAAAVWWATR